MEQPAPETEAEPEAEPTTPFALIGGAAKVLAVVERFYDAMSEHEPELARLHACDADGKVARTPRDRFGLFFIGWLGGPQDYVRRHGHPALRMRHGRVAVDTRMRDAWVRCMTIALDGEDIRGPVRELLDERLAQVADFLRNTPG